jgi:hypothetical protein
VTVFAAIRPDSWNFPLLVHVLGAMVLVGGVVTAAGAGVLGWRDDSATLRRLSFKTLLIVALPAWFVMFIGALWIASKEFPDDVSLLWLDIGHIGAEGGGLLLLISIILGGAGVRRSSRGGGGGLLKASSVIAVFLCAVYVVAIWAMGAKPS